MNTVYSKHHRAFIKDNPRSSSNICWAVEVEESFGYKNQEPKPTFLDAELRVGEGNSTSYLDFSCYSSNVDAVTETKEQALSSVSTLIEALSDLKEVLEEAYDKHIYNCEVVEEFRKAQRPKELKRDNECYTSQQDTTH